MLDQLETASRSLEILVVAYCSATSGTLAGAKHNRWSRINAIIEAEEDYRKRLARKNEISSTIEIINHNAALTGSLIINLNTLHRFIRRGGHGVCHSELESSGRRLLQVNIRTA